jgi:hypothetical protein
MATFPILTSDSETILTSDSFAVVVEGATPPSGGLFGPGTIVVYPDKEGNSSPYVDGTIMTTDGTVVSSVPNTVTWTADGACFLDGTCGVQQRQNSGTDWNFYVYDTNFNELSATTVFTGQTALGYTPAPTTDYSTVFYVPSTPNPTPGLVRSVTAAGVVGATTWTLGVTFVTLAAATDNSTFYYTRSNGIWTWDIPTNTAGSHIFDASTLPAGIGFSSPMRLIPTRNTLCVVMNNLNTGFVELWQFSTAGAILTTTVLSGLAGNTDCTAQVDLAAPSDYLWVRSYPGVGDRLDGCDFQKVRLDDGVIVQTFHQTIVEADGGVPGGVLAATCPLYAWSGGIESTSFPIRRLRRWMP